MLSLKPAGYLGYRTMLLACFSLWMLSTVTVSASYLDEIEQEALRGDATQDVLLTPSHDTANYSAPSETIQQGLDQGGFERVLQNNYYGSFLFYSRLNDQNKAVVYDEYKKNNDIDHLREIIRAKMK